jgi:hypothetical protein
MIPKAAWLLRPYSDIEYAARERACGIFFVMGFIAMCVLVAMGWRIGIISAVASVYTGAVFGCYMSRRTERGLWMLALLVAIGTAAFYALVLAMQIRDWLRSTAPQPWWVAVDLAVALGFVKVAIHASWTVVVQNRKIVK